MSGAVRGERARQVILYLRVRGGILFAELHPYTSGAIPLGSTRCDPNYLARDRYLFGLVHQSEEHEDLITDVVGFVGRHKQAAVLQERHIGRIQDGLVLNGQRQYAVTAVMSFVSHE